MRPRFRRYLTVHEAQDFIATTLLRIIAVKVGVSLSVCRDPDDDQILELAIAGFATHIITGDDDLLMLHPFRGILILTPQAFLDAIGF